MSHHWRENIVFNDFHSATYYRPVRYVRECIWNCGDNNSEGPQRFQLLYLGTNQVCNSQQRNL